MSVWTFAFVVTTVSALLASRILGRQEGVRGERSHSWSLIIAAGSIVGLSVSAQLSDLPVSAFRLFLVAAAVALAIATIHREAHRLLELRRRQGEGHGS